MTDVLVFPILIPFWFSIFTSQLTVTILKDHSGVWSLHQVQVLRQVSTCILRHLITGVTRSPDDNFDGLASIMVAVHVRTFERLHF